MAAEEDKTPVSAEQLAEADDKYKKALELRDKDAESAIQLLGEVLEVRNKAYGAKALECADVYLYYGQLLFEQAQANTDYLGEQMRSAALERARHIVSTDGDAAAAGSGDEAAADDNDAEDAKPEGAEAGPQQDDAVEAERSPPTADVAAAQEAIQATGSTTQATDDPAQAQAGGAADQQLPTMTAPADQQATATGAGGPECGASTEPSVEAHGEAAAAADQQEEDKGAEEAGKDNDDEGAEGSDEDVESDAEEAEGAEEDAQITGENDDMALAWEMLEMARLIYTSNDGAAKYASKLADCYMYIGDILAEQEKFEEAVKEYNTGLEMLEKVEGGLSAVKRRAAEIEFKRSTALQLAEQPTEALAAIRSAKAHLQARLNELNSQLASKSGGSSSTAADAAGAAAFAAFASVLTSYKPADAPDSTGTAEQAAADAALQQEIADLRSVIDSMNDRIDELTAAVDAHEDMKETIRKTFAMVSAGQQGTNAAAGEKAAGSGGAAAAAGPVETIGFDPAPIGAGPVKDMGLIGKGKRGAPVPVASEAAAAADAAGTGYGDLAEGSKKRPLSDVYNTDQQPAADKVAQDSSASKVDSKVQPSVEHGGVKKVKA